MPSGETGEPCFDDREGTSACPDTYDDWLDKLRRLNLPDMVIQNAKDHSSTDVIDMLIHVENWLKERTTNNDQFILPVQEWESMLKIDFPHVLLPSVQRAQNTFPNSDNDQCPAVQASRLADYDQWRLIILCILRETIEKLKNPDENGGEYTEDPIRKNDAAAESGPPTPIPPKNFWRFGSKPNKFIETTCFRNLLKEIKPYAAVQIHGGHLRGKTYALLGLLHHLTGSSFSEEELPDVAVLINCKNKLILELKKLMNDLKEKTVLTIDEANDVSSDEKTFAIKFIKLLQKKGIRSVLAFDNVGKDDVDVIRSIINFAASLDQNSFFPIRIIVTTLESDILYYEDEVSSILNFFRVKMEGFTDQDSLDYMLSDRPTDIISYRYVADDQVPSLYNLVTGAKELAEYYNHNPGCLRLAKIYCLTRMVSYEQYLKSITSPQAQMLLKDLLSEIAESIDSDYENAVQALHSVSSCTDVKTLNNVYIEPMEQVQKILLHLHHEDIPIHLIGKICQELRENSDSLTPEENFELNKQLASNVVYRLQERNLLQGQASINYPNGTITIQEHLSASTSTPDGHTIEILLSAILKMINKDNTERIADTRLHYLSPHIDALGVQVKKYLRKNFDATDKQEKTFLFAMKVSRLFELLGQSIIQGRKEDPAVKSGKAAADILMYAASLVYEVLSSFQNTSYFCFKSASDDLLEYSEGEDPKKVGAKIAKKAIKSGKKVKSQFIENYLLSSTTFRKVNLNQFIENTMDKQNMSEADAKEELKEIEMLIEAKSSCQAEHFEILRKSKNLLSSEQLQHIFFSERLSSIFHTYGRQVLYLQEKMSDLDQKKCEYYTMLSHHIAEASRPKTGVCLLTEYITKANAVLPRLLHNRLGETPASKMEKIEKARKVCEDLLGTTSDYYENGYFCSVRGSDYSNINVYKYLVKANTKMLKYFKKDLLPADAKEKCEAMLVLAYKNYFLDMVPHVIIQGAKFYAAAGYFPEAFDAFSKGFKLEKGSKVFGILQLRDTRPKAVAWAVQNFCMAVDDYSSSENLSQKELAKVSQAVGYCKMVKNLGTQDLGRYWMVRIDEWQKKMERLQKSQQQ